MLIGYVSDEYYSALCDVALVFESERGMVPARSLANGAVLAELPPGPYRVTLSKPGCGAKRVQINVGEGPPYQFRLLSDRLLGYAWPKWVRAGQASEFRVHCTESFKLSLWHYGWNKELVGDLGWFDNHGPQAMRQILPDGDFTRTGVKWNSVGFGSTWHNQSMTAPERSGLYYFHTKTMGGEFFAFPWIVMPDRPRAKIAVLTSNLTWNAYNPFGGRSNYYNQRELLAEPTVWARTDLERYTKPMSWPFEDFGAPLSFDRPEPAASVPEDARITDLIEGRLSCAFAPAEWRLLGWLEREGFAYDLYSETELHFDRLPLEQYRVLVLNLHNEYVSKEMYHRLKKWVFERGGRLVYVGGCAFLAELEFLDEHTVRCCQEEKHDHRGEPSSRLLGVAYSHGGYRTGAPFRVLDESHWAFAGTGLRNGDLFGLTSTNGRTPGGASGLGLDKLTPDAPSDTRHLAKGLNPDNSGADVIAFETPGGGAVFAAGSLNWPLACPVDAGVSVVTANVLRRFLQ